MREPQTHRRQDRRRYSLSMRSGRIRFHRGAGCGLMQIHGPGGEGHLDAFLPETAEDPLPELMPYAELICKFGHLKSQSEAECGFSETRVESNRRRRLGQQAGDLSRALLRHIEENTLDVLGIAVVGNP